MYNITLISTAHSEIGKCNADELYKIFTSISPEVVFEELTKDLFDRVYNAPRVLYEPLEIKCIKNYLQNHDIGHIPVDVDVISDLSTSNIEYMFNTFKKHNAYRNIEDEQYLLAMQGGFAYLNSKKCSDLFFKKCVIEKTIIDFDFNKNILSQIYEMFYNEQDNREKEMLYNIYDYSIKNKYNKAVFLIGSAHRDSMMRKITECKTKENLALNWTFYSHQHF